MPFEAVASVSRKSISTLRLVRQKWFLQPAQSAGPTRGLVIACLGMKASDQDASPFV